MKQKNVIIITENIFSEIKKSICYLITRKKLFDQKQYMRGKDQVYDYVAYISNTIINFWNRVHFQYLPLIQSKEKLELTF